MGCRLRKVLGLSELRLEMQTGTGWRRGITLRGWGQSSLKEEGSRVGLGGGDWLGESAKPGREEDSTGDGDRGW